MANKPQQLIVEHTKGQFWGRVEVKDNLIVDSASSLISLKKKMIRLVKDFEEIEVDDFEVIYDLTTFFKTFSFLNISHVAEKAGINPGLMRQYVSGVKYPSSGRVLQILAVIKSIVKELSKVKLHAREYA